MSTLRLIACLLAAAVLTACDANHNRSAPVPNATNDFIVTGMHCEDCGKTIASELKQVSGVTFAKVYFTNQLATVAFDTNLVSVEAVVKAIAAAGYEGRPANP